MYAVLKKLSMENKHFNVYKKKDLLDRWYYKNNRRIPPIFLLADPGYGFDDLFAAAEAYKEKYNITSRYTISPDWFILVQKDFFYCAFTLNML